MLPGSIRVFPASCAETLCTPSANPPKLDIGDDPLFPERPSTGCEPSRALHHDGNGRQSTQPFDARDCDVLTVMVVRVMVSTLMA